MRTAPERVSAAGLALLLLLLPAPGSAALLLSEILSGPATDWDGDGEVDSRSDEWVEIHNTGPGVESLDDVYLRDGTGDAYHFGFAGSLAEGEVLLVTGADAVAWGSASGLSLNNGGDTLELLRDQGTVVLLDSVVVPGHAATDDRSLARAPGGGAWILYDGMTPYGGALEPTGTGCAPSPGLSNTCQTTVPRHLANFGRVKSAF